MGKYGTFTVVKDGRTFVVEPLDKFERGGDWGHTDLSNKPQGGAVHPDNSVITEENGFKNIVTLEPGRSPLSYIDSLCNE